jgi:heptosyltransferase III
LRKINTILVIIQRSNGDVFLSSSLIKKLHQNYGNPEIDLLVNDDTVAIAELIPSINNIYTFSYKKKKENRWRQEINIITSIFKKYDLSINLTSSDRSVFYAILSGKKSISAIEKSKRKSWWKKILLTHFYYFDNSRHILKNNLEPLNILKINFQTIHVPIKASIDTLFNIKKKLKVLGITKFFIFHPSAQYNYKIYPLKLRNELLFQLNRLNVSVVITGSKNPIDSEIKNELTQLPNVFDFIGETSLEEYIALSELSLAYIGMDTLNMHIAASQNKRIFAIFGPTNLVMWSPWSNQIQKSATEDRPLQTYGNITIFQANMPCVACGNAGCDNQHGKSECLDHISPNIVYDEVKFWYQSASI